jgi:hypothetical protein
MNTETGSPTQVTEEQLAGAKFKRLAIERQDYERINGVGFEFGEGENALWIGIALDTRRHSALDLATKFERAAKAIRAGQMVRGFNMRIGNEF